MTEYVIRGGDVVHIERVGHHTNGLLYDLESLWLIKANRDTLEPCGLDTVFIIAAKSPEVAINLVLPVLGKDHDDYADSNWTIEQIGLDTRVDTTNKFVLCSGSW